MTAKEKEIKESYGEFWDRLDSKQKEHAFKNNGYITIGYSNEQLKLYRDLKKSKLFDIDDISRPKSISGIENNNGWKRIESEADLPKEKNASYYWYDIRVKERMEALKMILEPVSLEYLKQLHRADICTHWKKAEVQPSPIY